MRRPTRALRRTMMEMAEERGLSRSVWKPPRLRSIPRDRSLLAGAAEPPEVLRGSTITDTCSSNPATAQAAREQFSTDYQVATGQTLEEAFPTEYAAAMSTGTPQPITLTYNGVVYETELIRTQATSGSGNIIEPGDLVYAGANMHSEIDTSLLPESPGSQLAEKDVSITNCRFHPYYDYDPVSSTNPSRPAITYDIPEHNIQRAAEVFESEGDWYWRVLEPRVLIELHSSLNGPEPHASGVYNASLPFMSSGPFSSSGEANTELNAWLAANPATQYAATGQAIAIHELYGEAVQGATSPIKLCLEMISEVYLGSDSSGANFQRNIQSFCIYWDVDTSTAYSEEPIYGVTVGCLTAASDDGRPPPPVVQPEPVVTQPAKANVTYEPDTPPHIQVETPLEPTFNPGETAEFTPPQFDDYEPPPLQFPVDNMRFTNPSLDPCNFNMPSFEGGPCGPPSAGDNYPGSGAEGGWDGGYGGLPDIGGNGGMGGNGGGGGGGAGTSKYFEERYCPKNELVTDIITEICISLGLDPLKLIIGGYPPASDYDNPADADTTVEPDDQPAPCTQRWTGCFKKDSNKFDALRKLARLCGYGIIDDGGIVVIRPPKPTNTHHYLHENKNIFTLERLYTDKDLYEFVEVFRPPRYNEVGRLTHPAVSKTAAVTSAFEPEIGSTLPIYSYDYSLTDNQLQNLANFHAASISGTGAMVQVTTLYHYKYRLYDQLHLNRPSINWNTRWMIRKIENQFSLEGHLSVMQASLLGAVSA